jgi:hypothetical protein
LLKVSDKPVAPAAAASEAASTFNNPAAIRHLRAFGNRTLMLAKQTESSSASRSRMNCLDVATSPACPTSETLNAKI